MASLSRRSFSPGQAGRGDRDGGVGERTHRL